MSHLKVLMTELRRRSSSNRRSQTPRRAYLGRPTSAYDTTQLKSLRGAGLSRAQLKRAVSFIDVSGDGEIKRSEIAGAFLATDMDAQEVMNLHALMLGPDENAISVSALKEKILKLIESPNDRQSIMTALKKLLKQREDTDSSFEIYRVLTGFVFWCVPMLYCVPALCRRDYQEFVFIPSYFRDPGPVWDKKHWESLIYHLCDHSEKLKLKFEVTDVSIYVHRHKRVGTLDFYAPFTKWVTGDDVEQRTIDEICNGPHCVHVSKMMPNENDSPHASVTLVWNHEEIEIIQDFENDVKFIDWAIKWVVQKAEEKWASEQDSDAYGVLAGVLDIRMRCKKASREIENFVGTEIVYQHESRSIAIFDSLSNVRAQTDTDVQTRENIREIAFQSVNADAWSRMHWTTLCLFLSSLFSIIWQHLFMFGVGASSFDAEGSNLPNNTSYSKISVDFSMLATKHTSRSAAEKSCFEDNSETCSGLVYHAKHFDNDGLGAEHSIFYEFPAGTAPIPNELGNAYFISKVQPASEYYGRTDIQCYEHWHLDSTPPTDNLAWCWSPSWTQIEWKQNEVLIAYHKRLRIIDIASVNPAGIPSPKFNSSSAAAAYAVTLSMPSQSYACEKVYHCPGGSYEEWKTASGIANKHDLHVFGIQKKYYTKELKTYMTNVRRINNAEEYLKEMASSLTYDNLFLFFIFGLLSAYKNGFKYTEVVTDQEFCAEDKYIRVYEKLETLKSRCGLHHRVVGKIAPSLLAVTWTLYAHFEKIKLSSTIFLERAPKDWDEYEKYEKLALAFSSLGFVTLFSCVCARLWILLQHFACTCGEKRVMRQWWSSINFQKTFWTFLYLSYFSFALVFSVYSKQFGLICWYFFVGLGLFLSHFLRTFECAYFTNVKIYFSRWSMRIGMRQMYHISLLTLLPPVALLMYSGLIFFPELGKESLPLVLMMASLTLNYNIKKVFLSVMHGTYQFYERHATLFKYFTKSSSHADWYHFRCHVMHSISKQWCCGARRVAKSEDFDELLEEMKSLQPLDLTVPKNLAIWASVRDKMVGRSSLSAEVSVRDANVQTLCIIVMFLSFLKFLEYYSYFMQHLSGEDPKYGSLTNKAIYLHESYKEEVDAMLIFSILTLLPILWHRYKLLELHRHHIKMMQEIQTRLNITEIQTDSLWEGNGANNSIKALTIYIDKLERGGERFVPRICGVHIFSAILPMLSGLCLNFLTIFANSQIPGLMGLMKHKR